MAKKKLRVGLIGAGINMRKAHLPRIHADGAIQVVGVADPVAEAAQALMSDLGSDVPYAPDWSKLVEEEIDGLIISTPHHVHYDQVRYALDAGVPVLVEKPLTISARRSRALLKTCQERGLVLVVAYQRHHMAAFKYARELVEKGQIGEVQGVVGYVTQTPVARIDWRLDDKAAGGGMFADTGSHLVAASMWVSRLRPRSVTASVDNAGTPVDVNITMQIEYAGGPRGTLAAFGNAGRHDERLSIVGSEGSIVLRLHEWKYRSLLINDEPASIPKRIVESTPDAAFFGYLRSGGRGYEPPLTAHMAVQFTEAVYRSAAGARRVEIRT